MHTYNVYLYAHAYNGIQTHAYNGIQTHKPIGYLDEDSI